MSEYNFQAFFPKRSMLSGLKKLNYEVMATHAVKQFEEVSMKWIDRPIVTEMYREGVYKIEQQTWVHKN